MTLRLNGSTSGYTEIDAPAVAGSNTLVLPTTNGNADQALVTNGSGTLSFADRGRMVLATAQNSTSGTSIDFTGIPSWVKRVTVMFSGVSTNGTSIVILQLGTSSGFVTSGYSGSMITYNTSGANGATFTSVNGIRVRDNNAAANTWNGQIRLNNVSSNTWVSSGDFETTPGSGVGSCGITFLQALSGTLDRLRITTVNGTDTFDAGSINILYEG